MDIKKAFEAFLYGNGNSEKGYTYMMPPPNTLSAYNPPATVAWNNSNNILNWKYANTYTSHEGIYSIVSMLAQKFSSFPIYVYEVRDRKAFAQYKNLDPRNAFNSKSLDRALILKSQALEVVTDNPLAKLISEPNEEQSFNELLELYYGYKLIYGEGNLYLNSGGSPSLRPVEMFVVPPPMLGVVKGDDLWGIAEYYLSKNGVPFQRVDKENMIVWKYFNPVVDQNEMMHLRGLSPLQAAINTLEQHQSAQSASSSMYKNGGARGALYAKNLPRTLTPEQVATMIQQVNERTNTGATKSAIAALNGDWGYHDFGMSSIDMGLLDAQRLSLQRLCNIYGVPTILFDAEHTTYNNYESAIKQLVVNKLIPEWVSLRTLLNKKLTSRFAAPKGSMLYIDFDYTELPEIQKDLKDLNESVRDAHWLSYNERRAVMRYGARQEKECDLILIPTGYLPIQDVGLLSDNGESDRDTDDDNEQQE